MKNKCKALFVIVVILVLLCSCQSNPKQSIVTSKNDGAFDIGIVQSATIPKIQGTYPNENLQYQDVFLSSDGSVEFTMNIDEQFFTGPMPVVEIIPHYLTEDDAVRVANVLFGDCTYYESDLFQTERVWSKNDLQEYLSRWNQYTNADSLLTLFEYRSDFPGYQSEIAEVVKNSVEYYTSLYESAPDGNPHKLCDWTFKPSSYYWYSADELKEIDQSKDNESIEVMLKYNGIPYYIAFTKRNQNDFKLNSIFAYPYSGYSPRDIDYYIFRAQLCRTEEPTVDEIEHVKEKAQDMLERMNLGEWLIDECYVEETHIGEFTEYLICISATPILEGVPAIRQDQLANIKSEEAYASNYYLTDVTFQFSGDGELVYFEMISPIDLKHVINDNVLTLSKDELMAKAKTYFIHSDYYEYGLGALSDHLDEPIGCSVEICGIDYSLARVKVPNSDESYYYIPSLILYGSVENYGKETGALYYSVENQIFLTLNAIDGTIINTANE